MREVLDGTCPPGQTSRAGCAVPSRSSSELLKRTSSSAPVNHSIKISARGVETRNQQTMYACTFLNSQHAPMRIHSNVGVLRPGALALPACQLADRACLCQVCRECCPAQQARASPIHRAGHIFEQACVFRLARLRIQREAGKNQRRILQFC